MSERIVSGAGGVKLHVRDEGETTAPPVVLSHALGTTLSLWDHLAAALAPDHRVVRFDTRGHGGSDAPEGAYTVEDMGRDALAVLDALELRRVDFVGLSQGGMTGMWLAIHAPERIGRLVLANTTAFIPAKEPWPGLITTALKDGMDEIAPRTITGWLGKAYRARDPEGVAALVEGMRRMSPVGYAGAAAMLRDVDLRDGLARIQAPTLVIAGVEDGPRGAAAADALAAAIPDASRVDLPAAAHLAAIENPEAFNAAVMEFLGEGAAL